LEVGNNLTLKEAHEKAAELELAIKEELGENLELNIHLEPTQAFPLGGNRVEAKRIEEIKKFLTHIKKQISEIKDITDVSGRRVKNQIYLSFTCILDEKISLEKSHEISEKIEYLLKQQIPNLQKTSIHMEPYENKVRD
jgi:divalent metal cation (Fe/Co/Zn/Cd) transporter